MANHVHTRPERTSDEISADRKAATAFFHRFDGNNVVGDRDTQRLVAYYAHDWRLLRCDAEGRQRTKRVLPTAAQRAKATAQRAAIAHAVDEAACIPARGTAPLCPYAHAATRQKLPETALHVVTAGQRIDNTTEAARFWRRCATSEVFRLRLLRGQVPFTQWAIAHPDYGPLRDAPDHYNGSLRPAIKDRYRKGTIRPAGMKYERALEIAMRSSG